MEFKKVEKILKANGWVLVRYGLHYLYRKVGVPDFIMIPNHGSKDLDIDLINFLEKKTCLTFQD